MGKYYKHFIVVKFMAILKRTALRPIILFDINEIKLKDLIKIIVLMSNQEFNKRFVFNNLLSSDILVFINGVEIGVLNGLDTILKQGDEVIFLPAVHGGSRSYLIPLLNISSILCRNFLFMGTYVQAND
jgi:molybdopterin converting factor small subunit